MKILCLCEGGNTRSVTAATMLKYYWKHDALAASAAKQHPETLRMLVDWADEIVCVSPEIHEIMEERIDWLGIGEKKVHIFDIDVDYWGMSMHPDLVPRMHALLTQAFGEGKRTAEEITAKRVKYDTKRRERDTQALIQETGGG